MLLHGLFDIVAPNPMTAAPVFRLVDLQFRTLHCWKLLKVAESCYSCWKLLQIPILLVPVGWRDGRKDHQARHWIVDNGMVKYGQHPRYLREENTRHSSRVALHKHVKNFEPKAGAKRNVDGLGFLQCSSARVCWVCQLHQPRTHCKQDCQEGRCRFYPFLICLSLFYLRPHGATWRSRGIAIGYCYTSYNSWYCKPNNEPSPTP